MCKMIRTDWADLKASMVHGLLKKDFPQCGIKYTAKYGRGLVLVKKSKGITLEKIYEKALAANKYCSHIFFIPDPVAKVYGL